MGLNKVSDTNVCFSSKFVCRAAICDMLVCPQTLFFLSFSIFFFKGIQSSTAYNDLISYVP